MASLATTHASLSLTTVASMSLASTIRSEEHTSELQSHLQISYAVFCLKKIFFFNDTATTEIYTEADTLSLHDALPILSQKIIFFSTFFVLLMTNLSHLSVSIEQLSCDFGTIFGIWSRSQ